MSVLNVGETRTASAGLVNRRTLHHILIVSVGGQVERALGILAALGLRWGLDPARLGVYSGLKLFLDNTNRSSLGVGLGAVQQIPILRASGQAAEARHLANVAYTINTITCTLYAACLAGLALWRLQAHPAEPFAFDWCGGLLIIALLALLKRQESFLVAILRSHEEFALTTRADVLEAGLMALGVGFGLWSFGLWGLLAGIGLVLVAKILFLRAQNPWRFEWTWDLPTSWRLMRSGLPILANSVAFGWMLGLDRGVILAVLPDPEQALGLYSVALLGTSWCQDVSTRVVLVLYTHFQTSFGRHGNSVQVAEQAARATETLAVVLAPLAGVAFLVGPALLAWLVPRYLEGVPAFRPLMPGMLLLSLVWPARQMMISSGRPGRLLLGTVAGLLVATAAVVTGGRAGGLVGIALGMTAGSLAVWLSTSVAAYLPLLGLAGFARHCFRLALGLTWHAVAAWLAILLPLHTMPKPVDLLARVLVLGLCSLPFLLAWIIREGFLPSRVNWPWRLARC